MELQAVQKFVANQKRGRFFKLIYKKTTGEYEKVSPMVVRMVKYENIEGKPQAKGDRKPITTFSLLEGSDVIYFNENTKAFYLQVATSKVKMRSKCYRNGEEITIEEYNQAVKKSPRKGVATVLKLNLANIVALGE